MKKQLLLFLLTLLVSVQMAMAQGRSIHGVVIAEEDNLPVVGASVVVKGTTVGTITDIDGKFTLGNIPASGKQIEISYIGMVAQTLPITVGKTIKVVLKSDTQVLGEVVVTGLQRMDKRLFTGASDKLDADKVKMDGAADISRSLEGRSAGVSVQNVSGTFGTAPKIRVRGATSIYGNSKPLWVVDGVIMEGVADVGADELSSGDAKTLISSAISGLNSDDIESFQILKDGSATSIYGAKAMAGVIVITTKRGKQGSNRISYTGEYTIRLKPSYSNFNILNSQEQMSVYETMEANGYLNFADVFRAADSGVYGKMYHLMNTYDPETGKYALAHTLDAKIGYLKEAERRNTDWFDLLFRNNLSSNHAVSLTSGTDKASYYTSLSAMTDPGWTIQSKVNRYTVNANATYNLSKQLTLNLIGNGAYRKQRAPGTLSSSPNAVTGEVSRAFDINPYSYAINTSRTLDANEFYQRNYAPFNIFHELDNNYIDLDVVDLRFQAEVKWKPIQKVELTALGAYKYGSSNSVHKTTEYSNQAEAYRAMGDATIRDRNNWLYTNPDVTNALPETVLPTGGFYNETKYNMNSYDFRATASYNDVYNEKHILNLFGGMELNGTDRGYSSMDGIGLEYANGMNNAYNYLYFKQLLEQNISYYGVDYSKTRDLAFFGTATYSWQGRYTLNGTVRYEGSNKLGKSKRSRWLPTWNVSAAWNAHEEPWFEHLRPTLSNFTLKASYSLTADRGPSSVSNSTVIINSYNPYRPVANLAESGLHIVELENSELTYEKKHELNLGLEVGFLQNRINLAVDGYLRNNYDLIGAISTEGIGGQTLKFANVASMRSSGVEMTLSTRNVKTKDFSWNTDFIFSYAHNRITNLDNISSVMDFVTGQGFAREGYPVRSIFSFDFKGLDENGLPTFKDADGSTTVDGLNFQESDHFDHLVYEGPSDPTITGSFGNIFTYKNWRLNLFITYSGGNVVRLDPAFHNTYSDLSAMPREFINRWMMAGDEKRTNIPAIPDRRMNQQYNYLDVAYSAYNYSTARIAKGDFVRMKEISLSYDFPQKLIQPLKLSNLGLKLQATNLFLIYSDKKLNGQDPEFFNSGGVAVPMPKQFTLTLRVGI